MYACIDSALFIVKANNINPTWLIVLYANNLFILNCVKPKQKLKIKKINYLTIVCFFKRNLNKNTLCRKLILKRKQI